MNTHDLELERATIITSSDALRRIVLATPLERSFDEFPERDRPHMLRLQRRIGELRYALLTGTSLADFKLAFDGAPPPWASVAFAMKRCGDTLLDLDRRLTRLSERRLSA